MGTSCLNLWLLISVVNSNLRQLGPLSDSWIQRSYTLLGWSSSCELSVVEHVDGLERALRNHVDVADWVDTGLGHGHLTLGWRLLTLESLNHLLLLTNNPTVLRYYASQSPDTVMLWFETDCHFTVTSGTSHRHIQTNLFKMLFKFYSFVESLGSGWLWYAFGQYASERTRQ